MTNKNVVFHHYLALLFVILLNSVSLFAYNHPEIKWKTVTTKHFYIHYYDKTEPAVYAAWKIAEEAFSVFDSLYMFSDNNKIHLALADYDDYSNGYAAWTQRTIMVWVPDARYNLRSNTTWLRDVITHELAHIMSLDKKKGMQLLDWTIALEYASPNVNVLYGEPIAFSSFFPMWFAEGTAQLGAEKMGSDCWDSRRDMILRCAVLNNSLLSLDAMGNFTHDIIGSEKVYNQGYAFTKFLEERLGEKKIAQIWNKNRGRKPFGMSLERYMRKAFNLSLDALHEEWLDSLKTTYEKVKTNGTTKVTPVWALGTMNATPKISPDGTYWGWLTNHKDDFSRTDLVIAPYGNQTPVARIKYARTDWDFSADGNSVYYIKARTPNRNGSYLNDLFRYAIKENQETRLTRSARIYAVAASPNGEDLLCVQYKENIFSLVRFSLKKKQFTPVVKGIAGEPFLTISYLPSNTNTCIVSKIISGKAGLFTLDIDSGALEPLASTEAQEESPFCAQDGRIYFSADYDGIFNIYSLMPDGSDLKRHTSVTGGVFSPVVDKSGTLIVSEYTAGGFSIGTCSPAGIPYEMPNTPVCLFEPLPTPKGKVRIKSRPYKAKYLRPAWEIITSATCTDMDKALQDQVTEGEIQDSSWNIYLDLFAEIGMVRSDAVGKKNMYLGAAVVFNAGWQDDNDSKDTAQYSNRFSSIKPELTHAFYNAQPHDQKRNYQKRHGRLSPALKRDIYYATRQDPVVEDLTEEEDAVMTMLYIVPFFGIQNHKLKPTIGVDGMVALVSMIPAVFYIDPYFEWHITRDLFIGVSPTFSIMPLLLLVGEEDGCFAMTLPVWAQWQYYRYFNEDFYYNKAGLTRLSGYIGPDVTPYFKFTESDTVITTVTSLSFGVECMHAFPLFKYGSFSLSTENYGIKCDRKVSGRVGDIDSVDYTFLLTSTNRAVFTFPIIRNINRGRLYADNLYGKLFYQLDFAGTNDYFAESTKDVFFDKNYISNNASVSHWIGLGIELGLIKNHIFGRSLIVEAAWDIFDKEFAVDMSFWF